MQSGDQVPAFSRRENCTENLQKRLMCGMNMSDIV